MDPQCQYLNASWLIACIMSERIHKRLKYKMKLVENVGKLVRLKDANSVAKWTGKVVQGMGVALQIVAWEGINVSYCKTLF
jgi:hypothetical protein